MQLTSLILQCARFYVYMYICMFINVCLNVRSILYNLQQNIRDVDSFIYTQQVMIKKILYELSIITWNILRHKLLYIQNRNII